MEEPEIRSDFESLWHEAFRNAEKASQTLSTSNWILAIEVGTEAIKNFQKLLEQVQHQLAFSLYIRAKGYIGQKKFFRAKQDCETLLAIGSKNNDLSLETNAYVALGQALQGLSQTESAKEFYRRALLLNPEHEDAKQKLFDTCHNKNLPPLPMPQRLPDEMWVRIFSYLDIKSRVRLESVCKKWQQMALTSWYRVKSIPCDSIANDRPIQPDYFRGLLMKCGPFCQSVDIGCIDVARVKLEGFGRFRLRNKLRWLLQIMVSNCPQLQSLFIPTAAFLDEDLRLIFTSFTRLKTLCLEKVGRTPEGRLSGDAFAEVPESLEEIRMHFAQSSPCVNDTTLQYIADRARMNLKYFKLCSDWDSFSGEQALSYLLTRCLNLTTVKLGCLGHEAGESLTTACLENLGQLRNLRTLYLWASRISAPVVTSLVNGCKDLASMELHAESMDAEALTKVANFRSLTDLRLDVINGIPWVSLLPTYSKNNGESLKILALNALHGVELSIIFEQFPALEQLCLWNSVDVTAETLAEVIHHQKQRSKQFKLIASCYHIQMNEMLSTTLKDTPVFSIGCYFDHRPCDLDVF